ncbi:hypothetical protein DVH24_000768 [Malus domestica]|uniref:sucrose-phosphate synthase n=1 Tax=Malus domestica TaxID=3750 RepID=A0A498K2N1_MALDO|nr:hypothetical protein DVH24_000768 [Malus domestica]
MAGNEWINGYLEAILDSGASAIEEQKPVPENLRDRGHFNPTKYFVEEVVTGVDESDLYRTWIKVVATRNTRERGSRLENMCWRIWHLTRKKKQLEVEEHQRLANRRWEREQGRRDATEDMSEDLSEGEKGDGLGEMQLGDTPRKRFQRNISNLEVWSDDKKEKKLYIVIPPGMDFSNVVVQEDTPEVDGELNQPGGTDGSSPKAIPTIWSEVMRFLANPHKPMILALSRPDPKKNLTTLLKAFGECGPLRELANLTLIMGNRDCIDEMSTGNASVLTTVLKLIDKYDLYGQVAYPKHHRQSDVPDIYRLTAKTKGVFINPALVEPFGLTLIEAAAHGLPMVATKNGGPVDIHRARKVDDLRQKLRMRGLRCHPMYSRSSTRMQIVPLLASRAQALRYLFVRWRLNVANMYVFLGESGDTDYEEMISGTHKTIIMKGVVAKGSEELLRTSGSYLREDIVPPESPLVAYVSEEAKADEIANALKQFFKLLVLASH